MSFSSSYAPLLSNDKVFDIINTQKDNDEVGYYKLAYMDTSLIKEFAKSVTKKNIAVIGIGGSSLGAKAVYEFLKSSHTYDKSIHFFESTDPLDVKFKLKQLDIQDTLFIPISKSGDTIETISIFFYINSKTQITKENCVVIAGEDTKLHNYAKSKDIKTFFIPPNIGGRFSVFSIVGLLPLAILGVDIDSLVKGCRHVYDSYFDKKEYYHSIIDKARFMAENKYNFNINVVFSYFNGLKGFNKWYIQLWGESLGKIDKQNKSQGLTPIGLLGPMDQHSFLQLLIQGVRDKTVTFITLQNWNDDTVIPPNDINNISSNAKQLKFSELINSQANATIEAVENTGDIPFDIVNIDQANEYNLAKLMFSYQLLVSNIAVFLDIDAYNQPGVQKGKEILANMLK